MSEPNPKTFGSTSDRPRTPPQEQRRWTRHVPTKTRAVLSWDEGPHRITREAQVVNVSGGGAAVLSEQAPAPDQPLWIRLESGSGLIEAVEARSIEISDHPSGKRFLRLRFLSWLPLDPIFGQQEERRLWQRYPARENRAMLTWFEDGSERTTRGELLNISGGGAAIITETEPPLETPAWLGLQIEAPAIDPVESKVLGISSDASGTKFVRIGFIETCPIAFFELVVHGST